VGFTARKERGVGTFLAREELEKWRYDTDMAGALNSLPGFKVNWTIARSGGIRVQSSRGPPGLRGSWRLLAEQGIGPNGICFPTVYLDGLRMHRGDQSYLDNLRPEAVEAIEAYSGPATAPAQFNSEAICGVIVIWTRR
jgi:outer membrane receptor for ferrienterochelin and colicin